MNKPLCEILKEANENGNKIGRLLFNDVAELFASVSGMKLIGRFKDCKYWTRCCDRENGDCANRKTRVMLIYEAVSQDFGCIYWEAKEIACDA